MTIAIKHQFVSAIPDDGDTTIVQPSDWNDTHTLEQATARMLGRTTAGTGATEELTAAQVRTFLDSVPSVATVTALKALDTSSDTIAYLTASGREGVWNWRSGDYSTEITADTNNGIYAKADAIASTVGAWVRAYDGAADVLWFGATGDGTTDDASAIQAAVDHGGTIWFPAGTYRVDSTIDVTSSDTTLEFDAGASVDFSNAAITDHLIDIIGSAGSDVNLTADASEGDTSVSVAAGAESAFTAGDFVMVSSDDEYDASNVGVELGEIIQVLSTASGTVTFVRELQGGTYTTANTAKITPLALVENVIIRGLVAAGHTADVTDSNTQEAVHVEFARNVTVEKCALSSFNGTAISYENMIESRVADCLLEKAQRPSSGYGVATINAAQDILVAGCHFRTCRHAFTTANSTPMYGISRRVLVRDSFFSDSVSTGDAFDTHGAAEDIVFDALTVLGGVGIGINFECRSGAIRNCVIKDVALQGINVHNESDRDGTIEIVGNVVERCGSSTSHDGIRVQQGFRGTTAVYKSILISKNRVTDCAGSGILLRDDNANNENVAITDNIIQNPGNTNGGLLAQNCQKLTISANVISGAPGYGLTVLNSLNVIVSVNVVEFASSNTTYAAFRINATSANDTLDVIVTGNVHVLTGSAGTTKGVLVSNNADYIQVSHNNVRAPNTGIDLGTGANNTSVDNIT
jgi:hypothetical protein